MSTTARLLIIEDDPVVRKFLSGILSAHNYEVLEAESGEEGLAKAAQCSPDVILLDLGLPDIDGIEVATRLRGWMQVPIIVLSSREHEQSKVAALDAGADDYLTKPIGVAELQARIRVALRLARRGALATEEPVFHTEGLSVDMAKRQVIVNGEEIRLSPIEYKLLTHLVRNAGRVVQHRDLLQSVWGPEYHNETNYLRIYIKHLRDKLESNPAEPKYILTDAGIGYRFTTG